VEIKKGEAVGIIGRNGSGKSTLLQIIAGTLQPTAGTAKVRGRVAALLELGSGFNSEFTGRENVYLNGTVLGLSRPEIDARFDAIAAFADIGDFIEQPTKIYSSGMVMRLAFAVCAHVDADILIIDEALGVGDARFQLKCARTIDRFIAEGRTLLFVSHDVSTVKRLCNRALLLEQGRVLYKGKPNTVVNLYTKLLANPGSSTLAEDLDKLATSSMDEPVSPLETASFSADASLPVTSAAESATLRERLAQIQAQLEAIVIAATPQPLAAALLASERSGSHPAAGEYAYGGESGEILQRFMAGGDGAEKSVFTSGEAVKVRIRVRSREQVHHPIYALTIKSATGQEIYGTNTHFLGQAAPAIAPGEEVEVVFQFPLNLVAGEYFISLGWTYFRGDEVVVIHRRYDTLKFTVLGIDRTFGIAHLFAKISVQPLPPAPR
jgi:ABC-type polysaccharide/polyol phosphate transport system ATPase subunit